MCYVVPFDTLKAIYAASKRACTAKSEEVQASLGVAEDETTRLIHELVKQRQFCVSFVVLL